jgi:hypothetical protein
VAEEVGAAFVSLVPSARGFSAKTRAELRRELAGTDIPVSVAPKVDRAQLTRALTGATAGQRGAVPVATNVDPAQLRRQTRTAILATEATRPTVHVNVALDRDRLRRSLGGLGGTVERSGGGLGNAFARGFIQNVVFSKVGLIAGLIGFFTVPGGALVAGATLFGSSLAAIVVGAFALRGDREIRIAAGGLVKVLGATIKAAASPLKGPLIEALGILSSTVIDIAPDLAELFKAVAPFIPKLARGVSEFVKAFTPDLVEAVKASAPVIDQVAMALPDLGDGIGQFLTSMAIVAPEAAKFFGQFLRFTADLLRGLGQLIGFLTRLADGFVSMVKTVGSVVAAIGRMFWEAYQGWKIIIRVIRGDTELLQRMIGNAIRIIKEWWGRLWGTDVPGAIRAGVAAVVGVARLIPGRILGAIASLPGQMYQAGRNILQSLINGITSKLGGLRSIMSDAASIARAFWPFSPAKMGPLSGSGSLWYAGRNLVDDLTGGMQSRLPAVQSASSQLAGAVGVGSAGSMAAAGGRITIGSDGSRLGDLLLSVLQESVRARGGVDVVFAR